VPITGSDARRVVLGALDPFTGTRVCTVAPRNTGPAFRDSLAALRIQLAWLPTACPALDPGEALWRDGKQKVSANRA
jgi:hypothetical protein